MICSNLIFLGLDFLLNLHLHDVKFILLCSLKILEVVIICGLFFLIPIYFIEMSMGNLIILGKPFYLILAYVFRNNTLSQRKCGRKLIYSNYNFIDEQKITSHNAPFY